MSASIAWPSPRDLGMELLKTTERNNSRNNVSLTRVLPSLTLFPCFPNVLYVVFCRASATFHLLLPLSTFVLLHKVVPGSPCCRLRTCCRLQNSSLHTSTNLYRFHPTKETHRNKELPTYLLSTVQLSFSCRTLWPIFKKQLFFRKQRKQVTPLPSRATVSL